MLCIGVIFCGRWAIRLTGRQGPGANTYTPKLDLLECLVCLYVTINK